ncbi:hypothetical protein ManeNPV_00011 [Malacosoma neustria nucleopolyhedrovirus]|uniref:hypothetical protein n=1 Tax=Malacosoma neustria nuclear polyhedrosis virus TaxID=38012 RepID=UPI000E35976C|nr:hypothetical protein ManeNPV_00011 [Malacosoma neustria nucleopolyhedrovirus]AUF81539.1 hypothetical protein ManeNPV_00011 [Malacosoma neustria nucleopolyhedrovirus]
MYNEKNPRSLLPFSYKSVSKDRGFFSLYISCIGYVLFHDDIIQHQTIHLDQSQTANKR